LRLFFFTNAFTCSLLNLAIGAILSIQPFSYCSRFWEFTQNILQTPFSQADDSINIIVIQTNNPFFILHTLFLFFITNLPFVAWSLTFIMAEANSWTFHPLTSVRHSTV
jgi:hypothetical protein